MEENEEFQTVVWRGHTYHFTKLQAAIVRYLMAPNRVGKHIPQERILKAVGSASTRLADLFRKDKNSYKAHGAIYAMIHAGRKGTFFIPHENPTCSHAAPESEGYVSRDRGTESSELETKEGEKVKNSLMQEMVENLTFELNEIWKDLAERNMPMTFKRVCRIEQLAQLIDRSRLPEEYVERKPALERLAKDFEHVNGTCTPLAVLDDFLLEFAETLVPVEVMDPEDASPEIIQAAKFMRRRHNHMRRALKIANSAAEEHAEMDELKNWPSDDGK